jgi:ComF family protein
MKVIIAKALGAITQRLKSLDVGAHWREASLKGLDALFPPQPIALEQGGAHDFAAPLEPVMTSGLTASQWAAIRFLDRDGCEMCARPFEGGLFLGAGSLCSQCTEKPFSFGRGRAACLYDAHSRGLILSFKHADRLDLTRLLSGWVSRGASDILPDCDALIPVPLHPSRLLERRYNQSAEIARHLARMHNKTYLPLALRRTQRTPTQGKASPQVRWDNVKGAFSVSPAGLRDVRGRHIVLIDDVFTTGATLEACTRTLLKAGARRVDVAVIARAVRAE